VVVIKSVHASTNRTNAENAVAMNVMINGWFPMALHRRICEWCGCDNYEPDNNCDGGSRRYGGTQLAAVVVMVSGWMAAAEVVVVVGGRGWMHLVV
jgi:hypothetical protein